MTNDLTILFCHQGNRQRASRSQGVNNGSLRSSAVWRTVESGGDQRADFCNVMGVFWSYDHEIRVANHRRAAKTLSPPRLDPIGPVPVGAEHRLLHIPVTPTL